MTFSLNWTKILIIFLFAISLARAKADGTTNKEIHERMDQLKANMENSEFNFEQYSKNLDIVTENLKGLDQAKNKLTKMRRQVEENTKHAAMNNSDLDLQAKSVHALIQKEQTMIESESHFIELLRAKIDFLQTNQKKRTENISGYKKRLQEIASEKIEWDDQRKNAEQILTQISFKENQLNEERKAWASKEADYHSEVSKWAQESSLTKTEYKKYRKLSSE